MKTNKECGRRILQEVEKIEYGETISVSKLQELMGEYTIEDVLSMVTLLNKEHYLVVLDKVSYDDNDVFRENKIKGLTEKGYKALDSIRDETLWNSLKEKLPDFDILSIYTIFEIAGKIKSVEQNKIFDLPADLYLPNNRW